MFIGHGYIFLWSAFGSCCIMPEWKKQEKLTFQNRLLNGYDNLVKNKDGSFALYFGPTKPESAPESNWIQSIEGRDWLIGLRLYGSGVEFFDQTWKPDDVVKLK